MARRRKPPQITGEDLREYRRQVSARRSRAIKQPFTQRELAAELGVSTNTVARWERGEVPISPAVGALFVRVKEVRALHEQIAERASRLKRLKAENQTLKERLAWEQANKYETISQSGQAPAQQVYRRLAQKHHPDKGGNPQVMQAINELWRAMKKK